MSSNSTYSFMKDLCVPMTSYTGDETVFRDDMMTIPIVNETPISAHFCTQNYIDQAVQVVDGVESNPAISYIINFFNEIGNYMIVELKT
jgi:hypothetical protein